MDPIYTKTEESDDFKIPSDGLNATNTAHSAMITGQQLHWSRNEGVVPDFIQKLFNMLESTDETSCYHWGRKGTTFVIDDTNEFAKSVLPRRFKHGNFSSFVRQLNKYDFHKIRFTDNKSPSGQQQAWEFQHPLFQRDRKHLLAQIHRKVNNNRNQQIKHRQEINKSSSPSSSSFMQANLSQKSNTGGAMDIDSSAPICMQHLHDIHTSLQSQIDKLSSTQQSMESTLGRLLTTDTLLLNEIQGLKRKMDEKDSILSGLLEQSKQHRHSFYPVQQYQLKHYHPSANEPTLHTSSPMPSPQSPSLKLYPWLHPTGTPASSSSSSSTPTSLLLSALPHQKQPLSDTPPPSTMTTPIDSTSPITLSTIKKDSDGQLQYHPVTSITLPSTSSTSALPTKTSTILPTINTRSPPLPPQPLTLVPTADTATTSPPPPPPPPSSSSSGSSSSLSPSSGIQVTTQPTTTTSTSSSSTSVYATAPVAAPMEGKEQTGTCHHWSHRPKVLVVEDNVMYRRISMRCLQRLGCEFDLACDGLEAVGCMKTSKYDMILMDISIPKLDGMAATRKLRQYDQHTPVVSMTASYSDHDIDNYVGSGMSDLLPKPFDQHKLYDILKQHCAHLI
ncbi:unnamed protein product [Absidia cylindrospora]